MRHPPMKAFKTSVFKFFRPTLIVLATIGLLAFGSAKAGLFEITKQLEIFNTLFKELALNYVDEITPATLMDQAITGMLEGLDPYTIYWTEQEVSDAKVARESNYTNLGAGFRRFDNQWLVVSTTENGPADEAGMKVGDVLHSINGVLLSDDLNQLDPLVAASADREVALEFYRGQQKSSVSLMPTKSQTSPVVCAKLIKNNVAYIALEAFSATTYKDTKKALFELKAEGAQGLILDLRNNPGGLLTEAVNLVSLFVPKGTLVTYTQSAVEAYNQTYVTQRLPADLDMPVVVLINARSASASEIVSGALQDLDRAVIIGGRSFGKGLVQRPKPLSYGTQLKVTISRYYTPSGRCIQALDYWQRDADGDPIRTQPESYNAFKTKGGRTVYDGGGILPDRLYASSNGHPLINQLNKSRLLIDFGSTFMTEHPFSSPDEFEFSDKDFDRFLEFVRSRPDALSTISEKSMAVLRTTASKEGLETFVDRDLKRLAQGLSQAKIDLLKSEKMAVCSTLIEAILPRYFYLAGLYDYKLKHDAEVLSALEVLGSKKVYTKILTP